MKTYFTTLLSACLLFTSCSTPKTELNVSRVLLKTDLGDIELELDATHAPISVANFLRYVDAGLYNGGVFHRTVTSANQPTNAVKIEVIQASADPSKTNQLLPPISLERTRDTSLKHRDGTVSMARSAPDSAQDQIFICIGAQPELNFGGRRNRDGQGFAAFGKVTRGMDAVRKIHAAPADGQNLKPQIRIQKASVLN
jgi:peptidyl-prolyl cis-trans isomerase A (cyclophilin A)